MPTSLQTVRIPLPLAGRQPDRSPLYVDNDGLVVATNWMMIDGRFRVRPGWSKVWQVGGGRVMGIVQYEHPDESRRVVSGHLTGWQRLDKGTKAWVDITEPTNELTGNASNQQVFRIFDKSGIPYVLGVNGKDDPKKWDGDATTPHTYADIGGTPPIAKCMAIAGDRVLLGYLDMGGSGVLADAFTWSDSVDMDSGWADQVRLADTPGQITSMLEMGNLQTACYKEDAIYMIIAQASEFPFRVELRKSNIAGPVSPLSVVPLPDGRHCYLAQDFTVMTFDGSSLEPLGGVNNWRKVQKGIIERIDANTKQRTWGVYDQEHGLVWFVFPYALTKTLIGGVAIDVVTGAMVDVEWRHMEMSCGTRLYGTIDKVIGDLDQPIGSYGNAISEWTVESPILTFGAESGQIYKQQGTKDEWTVNGIFYRSGVADDRVYAEKADGAPRLSAGFTGEQLVMVEEGTTNVLSENQATGTDKLGDTTGFAGNLGSETLTSDTAVFLQGAKSLKAVLPGAANDEGVKFSATTTAGQTYTLSIRCLLTGAASYPVVIDDPTTGASVSVPDASTWVTLSGQVVAAGASTEFKALVDSVACSLHLDALQVELKPYATSWKNPTGARGAEYIQAHGPSLTEDAQGTIAGWLRLLRAPGSNIQTIVDLNGGVNKNLLLQITAAGKLECVYGSGASDITITGTTVINTSDWVGFAVRWDSTGVQIFLQPPAGVWAQEGTSASVPSLTLGNPVYIGATRSNTLQVDAQIYDLSFWSTRKADDALAAFIAYREVSGHYVDWDDDQTWLLEGSPRSVGQTLGSHQVEMLTFGQQEIHAVLETGLKDLGDINQYKTLVEAMHLFAPTAESQEVKVAVAGSNYGEPATFSDPEIEPERWITLNIWGNLNYTSGHRLTARAFAQRVDVWTTQLVEWMGVVWSIALRGFR